MVCNQVISKTILISGQGSMGKKVSLFTSVDKSMMKPTLFSVHSHQFLYLQQTFSEQIYMPGIVQCTRLAAMYRNIVGPERT